MEQLTQPRVTVVTGAGRGIGRAMARKLATRGDRLVLVDLEEPTDTAALVGDGALPVAADVTREEDWVRLAATLDARFGRVDCVVNNAGGTTPATIDELDAALWRRTLALNLDSHFFSAKYLVPLMRRHRWGRFVNVSSNSIGTSTAGLSHYMASKMGVIGFVRGLANDVGGDGITVNALLPAITNTALTSGMPEADKRAVWEAQAIKRFAEPEDIAGPVLFLTSDEAEFVTGQAVVVDGGMYKMSWRRLTRAPERACGGRPRPYSGARTRTTSYLLDAGSIAVL